LIDQGWIALARRVDRVRGTGDTFDQLVRIFTAQRLRAALTCGARARDGFALDGTFVLTAFRTSGIVIGIHRRRCGGRRDATGCHRPGPHRRKRPAHRPQALGQMRRNLARIAVARAGRRQQQGADRGLLGRADREILECDVDDRRRIVGIGQTLRERDAARRDGRIAGVRDIAAGQIEHGGGRPDEGPTQANGHGTPPCNVDSNCSAAGGAPLPRCRFPNRHRLRSL
jgi:hypothetical protein